MEVTWDRHKAAANLSVWLVMLPFEQLDERAADHDGVGDVGDGARGGAVADAEADAHRHAHVRLDPRDHVLHRGDVEVARTGRMGDGKIFVLPVEPYEAVIDIAAPTA